jgi:hypothetical protein
MPWSAVKLFFAMVLVTRQKRSFVTRVLDLRVISRPIPGLLKAFYVFATCCCVITDGLDCCLNGFVLLTVCTFAGFLFEGHGFYRRSRSIERKGCTPILSTSRASH